MDKGNIYIDKEKKDDPQMERIEKNARKRINK